MFAICQVQRCKEGASPQTQGRGRSPEVGNQGSAQRQVLEPCPALTVLLRCRGRGTNDGASLSGGTW